MTQKVLYFVTGNKNKIEEVKNYIKNDINIETVDLESDLKS